MINLKVKDIELPAKWLEVLAKVQEVFPEALIAGGALRDLILGREIKDIDVFVRSRGEETQAALASIYGDAKAEHPDLVRDYGENVPELQGVYTLHVGDGDRDWAPDSPVSDDEYCPFQIIALNQDVTPDSCLGRFDFGICRVATDGKTVFIDPAFTKDIVAHTFTLLFCNKRESSMKRFTRLTDEKYRGWTLVDPDAHQHLRADDFFL